MARVQVASTLWGLGIELGSQGLPGTFPHVPCHLPSNSRFQLLLILTCVLATRSPDTCQPFAILIACTLAVAPTALRQAVIGQQSVGRGLWGDLADGFAHSLWHLGCVL